MSGSLFFLNYQFAKMQARAAILGISLPQIDAGYCTSFRTGGQQGASTWLNRMNTDALTWVRSLVDPDDDNYQQRRDLAKKFKEFLDTQETELDSKIKSEPSKAELGLWARLRFRFAGLSTLLPGRNMALCLGVVLFLSLMVSSLAVMAQAGMLAASTWILGNTLTSAALWLAAQLSITTLGLPGLIAVVTLGAWLAAALIVEWKFRGTIGNAFFGLTAEGTEETGVYHSHRKAPDLFGKIENENEVEGRLFYNPFFYPAYLLRLLDEMLFFNKGGSAVTPSSRPFAFMKGLVHFALAALAVPFLAVVIIVDSVVLALQLIWGLPPVFAGAHAAGVRLEGERGDASHAFRGDPNPKQPDPVELRAMDTTPSAVSSHEDSAHSKQPSSVGLGIVISATPSPVSSASLMTTSATPTSMSSPALSSPAIKEPLVLTPLEQRAVKEGWVRCIDTLLNSSSKGSVYYLNPCTQQSFWKEALTEGMLDAALAQKRFVAAAQTTRPSSFASSTAPT